mgnify:FL=1
MKNACLVLALAACKPEASAELQDTSSSIVEAANTSTWTSESYGSGSGDYGYDTSVDEYTTPEDTLETADTADTALEIEQQIFKSEIGAVACVETAQAAGSVKSELYKFWHTESAPQLVEVENAEEKLVVQLNVSSASEGLGVNAEQMIWDGTLYSAVLEGSVLAEASSLEAHAATIYSAPLTTFEDAFAAHQQGYIYVAFDISAFSVDEVEGEDTGLSAFPNAYVALFTNESIGGCQLLISPRGELGDAVEIEYSSGIYGYGY